MSDFPSLHYIVLVKHKLKLKLHIYDNKILLRQEVLILTTRNGKFKFQVNMRKHKTFWRPQPHILVSKELTNPVIIHNIPLYVYVVNE